MSDFSVDGSLGLRVLTASPGVARLRRRGRFGLFPTVDAARAWLPPAGA